ncbi:uncharacterized protein LOC113496772 [Trichoplusia ni]|uniref:Uncharacterized protein LOC113496772 n=1 Tax=Trichoplusia ni TaxID=7111 RepID=A0A7E5VU74_TRINI|nr:uncharacterized protein LOC113496772 [Trichoplusia ni]
MIRSDQYSVTLVLPRPVDLYVALNNLIKIINLFSESTPNGESIVAISSSDPNVEKYFSQQFATRSGFTQLHDDEQNRAYGHAGVPQGAVHSTVSIAGPSKAVASAGRSIASASSGPFLPLFNFPILPEGFGFNNFDVKDWVRNVESFYNPNFPGNAHVNTATAINDNGHVYGNVNAVTFDNRAKPKDSYGNTATSIGFDNRAKTPETAIYNGNKNVPVNNQKRSNF